MAYVATHGSTIADSYRNGYVLYDIYDWERVGRTCTRRDPETNECLNWRDDYDWVFNRTDSTSAKISGTVISSSNVCINDVPIAYQGCGTTESWVADPPVPSNTSTRQYRNVRPASSGSGSGTVTSGNSSNVYVNGQSVAVVGSSVSTMLNTSSSITSGDSGVHIG